MYIRSMFSKAIDTAIPGGESVTAAQDRDADRSESMALVTDRRLHLGLLPCEACKATHPGGSARGVLLQEPDLDEPWLLWVLPDGWSWAEHSDIAVCSQHQSNALIRSMRFAE